MNMHIYIALIKVRGTSSLGGEFLVFFQWNTFIDDVDGSPIVAARLVCSYS